MVGPPPPPPPPPPPTIQNVGGGGKAPNKAKLLNEIHGGIKLKKAVTNDRSAPIIGKVGQTTTSANTDDSNGGNGSITPSSVPGKATVGGSIGALFANGVPKKPSEAKNISKQSSIVKSPPPIASSEQNPPAKLVKPFQSKVSPTNPEKPLRAGLANSMPNPSPKPLPPSKVKPALPAIPPSVNKPTIPQSSKPQPISIQKVDSVEDAPPAPPPSRIVPARRPAAPPPPPPPPSAKPTSSESRFRARPPMERHPSVASNSKNNNNGSPPPPPPPRNSSYVESIEQRFHFIQISELPPPPKFVGFRKEYDNPTRVK